MREHEESALANDWYVVQSEYSDGSWNGDYEIHAMGVRPPIALVLREGVGNDVEDNAYLMASSQRLYFALEKLVHACLQYKMCESDIEIEEAWESLKIARGEDNETAQ